MKKQILRVFMLLALFTALPGCGNRQGQNAFAYTTSNTAAVETTAAETKAAETATAGEAKEKMLRMMKQRIRRSTEKLMRGNTAGHPDVHVRRIRAGRSCRDPASFQRCTDQDICR